MAHETFIMALLLFTLCAGLAVGFYQLYSVNRAKERGSTSAIQDHKRPPSPTA